jgi:ethanolamine ammonia-lyase small subunit
MDQSTIDEIVQAVMAEIDRGVRKEAGGENSQSTSVNETANALPDLSQNAVGRGIGVRSPNHPAVVQDFHSSTASRVAVGRAGPRPKTIAMLRFLADHSRSKDTVLKDFPSSWVETSGLLELRTEIIEKDQFLTRPDLGRRLSQESVEKALRECKRSPQAQLIVSDGLSTDAVVSNFDEIIPPLLKGLNSAGMDVGTPVFVRHGRVKMQDHLGEVLGAKVAILLIGERPGLGQSESLSCYMVYNPRAELTVESDRICISNIHAGGTPPVEAAAVIVDAVKKMLREGLEKDGPG